MISSRMQDKISGTLSGWYTSDWGTNIQWKDGKLMVKDYDLADEILFNLKQDGIELNLAQPSDPAFSGWGAELIFG